MNRLATYKLRGYAIIIIIQLQRNNHLNYFRKSTKKNRCISNRFTFLNRAGNKNYSCINALATKVVLDDAILGIVLQIYFVFDELLF